MLIAMMEGSFASSPMILSAGGQDEQPCEVKSSTTARGSAIAGRMTATIAQTPKTPETPDHFEIELQAIIAVMLKPELTKAPGLRNRRKQPLLRLPSLLSLLNSQ